MQQENKVENKMMFKIKALLDKAASTDSQEEKDAFMIKAQELIKKHNLDTERIMAVRGGIRNGVFDENIVEETTKYESEWDRKLMENIATGNMCKVLFSTYISKIHIIGRESNANSVIYLCDFYRKAILNLAVESAKKKSRVGMALLKGTEDQKSKQIAQVRKDEKNNIQDYLFGAVDGLKDALTKKEEIFMSESFAGEGGEIVTGRQVVKVNRDLIDEYIQSKYGGMLRRTSFSGGGNSDSQSYNRGYNDGGGLGSGQKRLN